MQSVTFEDWCQWQSQGVTPLPAVAVHADATLPATWDHLTESPVSILLESAHGGRYSFVCDRPARVIVGDSEKAEIWSGDMAARTSELAGDPLAVLRTIQGPAQPPRLKGWPTMLGGLMGVLGYDVVHTWKRLPRQAKRDLSLPLYLLLEPAELFVFDHVEKQLGIVTWLHDVARLNAEELRCCFDEMQMALERASHRWRATAPSPVLATPSSPSSDVSQSLSPNEFRAAVLRAKEDIAAGDTYQVNLSLRTSRPVSVDAGCVYEELRKINPSPYMGLLRTPGFSLVCGSPELLVRLADGVISSRPIAGTRPRGEAAAEDVVFSAELLASEKERAEHLMLVDLIRNDIGRVAEFGSVHVAEFMAVEQYSHVMHIVSQVEGRLAPGQTWMDVFRSMFPGGTITGCPKVRTMEIIEELEPVGRGYYTGALGWISYSGEMEMNIIIRSMLIKDGVAHVQAGAGIVADSQPDRELDEALRKARALWVALDRATSWSD